jgi:hypothetical protein
LAELQKVIDRKEQMRKSAPTLEQKDIISVEIQSLEWVRMIIRGSDKERENYGCHEKSLQLY